MIMSAVTLISVFLKSEEQLKQSLQGLKLPKDYVELQKVVNSHMTLTDFTLHFSCCFTKILHSQLNPLLNNFTMQEKCY